MIRKILMGLAAVVGFTTVATAATPVAVWDGNFPAAGVEDQGFILTYNGNTRGTEGESITIADTAGLGVTFAKSGMAATTVAVKYSNYTGSDVNETLGTFSANSTAANRVGIHRYSNGTIYGSHSSGNLTNSKDEGTGSFAGSTNKDVFFLRYSKNGVSIFAKDGTCLYRKSGYKFGADFDNKTVYAFTVGGASTSTFSSLAAATGMQITGVAVFASELSSAEMAAYKFPSDLTPHEATVDEEKDWSKIDWIPAITDPSSSKLELEVTDEALITMDEDPNCYSLDVTGTMKIKVDAAGEDLAKKTAAGAPYADWLFKTTATVTGTFEPVFNSALPKGYTASTEILPGQGVRYIVTAPATAMFGAVNINIGSETFDPNTTYGIYPDVGSNWNSYTPNNDSATKFGDVSIQGYNTDGTYSLKSAGTAANKKILITHTKDKEDTARGFNLSGLQAFAGESGKYRIIVYEATDTVDVYFAPVSIAGVMYTGAGEGANTSTVTIKDSTKTRWGASGPTENTYGTAEGVNAVISDVLTADTVEIRVTRKYNNNNSARGSIAAIQIVKVGEVTLPPTDYSATINESVDFSEINNWDPERTTVPFRAEDTITFAATDNATLILNEDFTIGTLKVESDEDVLLTLKKGDITANVGTLDITEAVEGVAFDATEGYTACPATLTALRTTDVKIAFPGDGENGATLDYGTSYNNYTFAGHYVFDAGTHVFQNASEKAYLRFGANATEDNPTFWVKNGATLTFKSRNPCGYSDTTANTDGIIRIGEDSKVIVTNSVDGTWYWSQQFYFENNSSLAIETPTDKFRVVGGDTEGAPQFYLPDGTATITGLADNYFALPSNDGSGVAFEVGEDATLTVSANLKTLTDEKPFVKKGEGTLKLTGDLSAFAPAFTVGEGKLVFAMGGTYRFKYPLTNNGTIVAENCNLVFMEGVTPGTVETTGTGAVYYGYTVDINDLGEFALPAGREPAEVKLYNEGGEEIEATYNEVTGKFEFEWGITGKNCWWDYGFDGNLTSTGADTTTMNDEKAKGVTDPYNEDHTAILVGYGTPYRSVTYPEEFTAVIYGKMVNNDGHMEIGFGSTTSGTTNGVVIACGDPEKDEANLHITLGYSIVKTIPMTVTDPYETDHLYAFTCQTINDGGVDKTKVSVYLDGKFLQAYTFDSKITLGSGFQVGSIHGGSLSGCTKATTANTHAELDFLRVYKTVLSAEAMAKYAEEYPYTSKGGASVRTFDDSLDQTWVAYGTTPWTVTPYEQESFPTNTALAGSIVTIGASADAEVTMNLDANTTYESLKVNAGSAIVFKAGEDAVEPTITGGTTIKTDVMVDYNAIKFGTVEVASGKTLTFDFTDYPWTTYFADATIPFTGATSGDGTITATGLPEPTAARTVVFEKNTSTDQYELKITVDPATPFVYEDGAWTFDDVETTVESVNANTSLPVVMNGEESDVQTITIAARTVTVKGGTIKANDKGSGTVTVNGGAFDVNGKEGSEYTVILKGGAYVNTGAAIGNTQKQIKQLTVEKADSTVDAAANFGLIAGNWGANTLDLGWKKLTKTGAATFWLASTTVTNGTFEVAEGTLEVTGNADTHVTVFADDATLVLGADTTLAVTRPLTIGAITANGATINNTKSITPFTLTGSATLTGTGTWGTNNIAGATVTIGQNRDFVFAGNGTVNVTLTDDEYEGEMPITLFTNDEGAASVVGTVMYNDEDITSKCTISGNQITAIEKGEAKIGTTYYLTLAAALDAAEDKDEITLLKDVAFTPNGKYTLDKTIYLTLGGFDLTGNGGTTFEVVNGASLYVTATDSTVSALRINVGRATNDNGSLFINGGTWTIDNNAIIHVNGTCKNCWVTTQDADFTSNGDNAIQFCGAGTFSIDGGTITGATAVYVKAGTLSIAADLVANGPKTAYVYSANGANATGDALVIDNCGYPEGPATVSLLAGTTLTSAHAEKMGYYVYNSSPEGTVTKDATVDVNTPEGYLWKDGTTLTKAAARIGTTTYYLTFAEALEAVQDGDTLTLCKDVTTAEPAAFTITNKNVTVDFADYTITKTVANDWVFQIAKDADVIFKGGKGGIVHYPAVLNPVNPASMIQILGKLTVAGGAYKSDYTIFKVDEDDKATHTAKGELVVNAGTFTIEPQPETTYAGKTYAVMNWSKATLSGGTFTGTIATFSDDGNTCSQAGETIVNGTIAGTPVYTLQVMGSTYKNVPKIKGVDIDDVTLVKSASITDTLILVEDGEYVTVQKKPEIEPVDPSKEDVVIECKDADTATVLAAAITLNPASFIKAPAAVTDPEDVAKYQALFCGRALANYVYIELTDKAIEDLQAEVDATTVTESVAASLIEPTATSVTIQALAPGLYYWVEGAETPDFEDLVQGSAGMATASGISLELVKPETIGTSGKQFYKIAVDTKDPNPEK